MIDMIISDSGFHFGPPGHSFGLMCTCLEKAGRSYSLPFTFSPVFLSVLLRGGIFYQRLWILCKAPTT